jgi:hypothetical protein
MMGGQRKLLVKAKQIDALIRAQDFVHRNYVFSPSLLVRSHSGKLSITTTDIQENHTATSRNRATAKHHLQKPVQTYPHFVSPEGQQEHKPSFRPSVQGTTTTAD